MAELAIPLEIPGHPEVKVVHLEFESDHPLEKPFEISVAGEKDSIPAVFAESTEKGWRFVSASSNPSEAKTLFTLYLGSGSKCERMDEIDLEDNMVWLAKNKEKGEDHLAVCTAKGNPYVIGFRMTKGEPQKGC